MILVQVLFLALNAFAGQFTITKVYDGDTVTAEGHDIIIKVRLAGIDCPELSSKQPYGQEGKEYLSNLILNKTVDIQGYGLDRYSRVLGVITLDGQNINLVMEAEQDAKKNIKGMWILKEDYISPSEWRKLH